MAKKTFFLFHKDDVPNRFFAGSFWHGADLYMGDGGARAFRDKFGPIPSDLDGEYVTLRREGGKTVIGGDFNNLVPMFLYCANDFWAVANSFLDLVELARSRGLPLTIVPDLLAAWRPGGDVFQRPTTWQTVVAEIQLAPSYCDIHCTGGTAEFVKRPRQRIADYATAMQKWREETISRYHTIINSGRILSIDLTGGIDSRANFAIAWDGFGAEEFRKLISDGKIRVRSSLNHDEDISIATAIATTLDIPLYTPGGQIVTDGIADAAKRQTKTAARTIDASEDAIKQERIALYRRWARGAMGCYAVVQPYAMTPETNAVQVSGVFGGSLKSHDNTEMTVADGYGVMEKYRKHFDSTVLFDRWRSRVIENLETVARDTGVTNHAFTTVANREFYMRLHAFGRIGAPRIFPLGFGSVTDAVAFLDAPQLRQFKVHHDAIHPAGETVFRLPYDAEKKYPSDDLVLEPAAPVSPTTTGSVTGRIPGSGPSSARKVGVAPQTLLLQATYRRAIAATKDPAVQTQLGDEYCQRTRTRIKRIPNSKAKFIKSSTRAQMHGVLLTQTLMANGAEMPAETERPAGPNPSFLNRGARWLRRQLQAVSK